MIRIFVSCLKPSLEIYRLQINIQMADLMDVPLMFPFPEIQAPWGWWILVFTGLSCLLRPWLTLWSNQVCSPSNSTHSLRTLRVGHQKPSTSGPVWVHIWALCWLFPLFCFLQSQALGVNLRRARHWFTLPPDRTVLYPAPTDWRGKWACGTPSGYEWAQHRHLETHRFETEAVYLMIRLNLLLGFLSAGKILINNKTNFGFLILSKEVKKRLLQDDNVYAVYLEFLCSLTPFNY